MICRKIFNHDPVDPDFFLIMIMIAIENFHAESGKKISLIVCLNFFNQSLLKNFQPGSGCE